MYSFKVKCKILEGSYIIFVSVRIRLHLPLVFYISKLNSPLVINQNFFDQSKVLLILFENKITERQQL